MKREIKSNITEVAEAICQLYELNMKLDIRVVKTYLDELPRYKGFIKAFIARANEIRDAENIPGIVIGKKTFLKVCHLLAPNE